MKFFFKKLPFCCLLPSQTLIGNLIEMIVNLCLVFVYSKKQPIIFKSSTEAEYRNVPSTVF